MYLSGHTDLDGCDRWLQNVAVISSWDILGLTIFKAQRHSKQLLKECTWGVNEHVNPCLATSGVTWMHLRYAPLSKHSPNESHRVIAGLKAPRPFFIYSSNRTANSQISGSGKWVGTSKYGSLLIKTSGFLGLLCCLDCALPNRYNLSQSFF